MIELELLSSSAYWQYLQYTTLKTASMQASWVGLEKDNLDYGALNLEKHQIVNFRSRVDFGLI